MKHTEPKIGQLVYVINKDIFVRVIDKESIEGITLFYTDDNLSYIENQLHYITKWKPDPDDAIKEILFSVMEDLWTPDDTLKINVDIYKSIGKPFGKIKVQG
jgi:hypothetical protein